MAVCLASAINCRYIPHRVIVPHVPAYLEHAESNEIQNNEHYLIENLPGFKPIVPVLPEFKPHFPAHVPLRPIIPHYPAFENLFHTDNNEDWNSSSESDEDWSSSSESSEDWEESSDESNNDDRFLDLHFPSHKPYLPQVLPHFPLPFVPFPNPADDFPYGKK